MLKNQNSFSYFLNPYITFGVLSFLVHFFLIFNNGLFVDDWAYYKHSLSVINEVYINLGYFPNWPPVVFWLVFKVPFFEKILTMLCMYVIAILNYKILISSKFFKASEALFVTIFSIVFPYYIARFSNCLIHYTICTLLFYLGFYLVTKYLKSSGKKIYRISALVLFFISFSMNSVLVYYAAVLAYILYFELREKSINLGLIYRKLLTYLDFILLPIVYFVIKTKYYQASGLYANGYNQIGLLKPGELIKKLIEAYRESILKTISEGFLVVTSNSTWVILFFIFLVITLALFIRKKAEVKSILNPFSKNFLIESLFILIIGWVLFCLAAVPYILVGKMTMSVDFESRHQVLLGLPIGIIGFQLLKLISSFVGKYRSVFFISVSSIAISFFVAVSSAVYFKYLEDFVQQEFVEVLMPMNKLIRDNSAFFVTDNFHKFNHFFQRHYNYYEYTGISRQAFGNTKRLYIKDNVNGDKMTFEEVVATIQDYDKNLKSYKQHNFDEFLLSNQVCNLNIVALRDISMKNMINIVYNYYTNEGYFRSMANDYINLDVKCFKM